MKTAMIAAALLAALLVSMVGAGRIVVVTRSEAGPPGQDDPAPRISVRTIGPTTVTITRRYAAQIHSRRHIQALAPVAGTVAPIPIKQGQAVKTGDRIFEITSPILKAKLDAARAERNLAQSELDHATKLAEQKAVPDDELKRSEARLAQAQAKLDLARAELDAATFRAPFDGIVDRLDVREGVVVKPGETIATLCDNSVMWVIFPMPADDFFEYDDDMYRSKENKEGPVIELMLSDRRKFPHPGRYGGIMSMRFNEDWTVPFRADFPNPDGLLQHGQTGTVSIDRVLKDVIVIPKRAKFKDHDITYVFIVDNQNIARKREIIVHEELDDGFVEAGVEVGDRIVSDQAGMVHDGDKVNDE